VGEGKYALELRSLVRIQGKTGEKGNVSTLPGERRLCLKGEVSCLHHKKGVHETKDAVKGRET